MLDYSYLRVIFELLVLLDLEYIFIVVCIMLDLKFVLIEIKIKSL